ncbi:MAG: Crp/Fnr family transcriptional regulator [Brevundimonas sp.]|nr:Crp/Fnr family transcriptional regulator [Brevundimonas sp.]
MISPLIQKLARRDELSGRETTVLGELLQPPIFVPAGRDIVRQHSSPAYSTLILDGFAARYVVLTNGARQITELNVPGDFVDLHSLMMSPMDHGVVALTSCTVARSPHDGLRRVTETEPHLTRLLWMDTLVDAAVHRQWIAGLGRRTAVARLAHLLCELYLRLKTVHRAGSGRMELPLSQAVLADVLGLSDVHVNRSIAQLRAAEMVRWAGRAIEICDWDALVRQAEFDPTYLRLGKAPV